MAAWTGDGFTANYIEPGSSVEFCIVQNYGVIFTRATDTGSAAGNTTGNGQVFP